MLFRSAYYGTPEATKLLLEEGADPLVRNYKGLSALDFAKNGPHQESARFVEAFMRAAMAKQSK